MAFITFYHVSEQDIQQLSAGLMQTDHHWEYVSEPLSEGNIKPESEMISVSCGNIIDRALLSKLPNLRMIAVRCQDFSKVDLAAAAERDITVTYVPEEFDTTHETINRITDESIIKYWYGEVPYRAGVPATRFGKLVLTRHGESEYNRDGRWTGSRDVHLTEKGLDDARKVGEALKDITFNYAISSEQQRSIETLDMIMNACGQYDIPLERSSAVNERDYGDYTGLNKWEVKDKLGEEKFNALRRGWNEPVPNGETLQDVYNRAVPYFIDTVLPILKEGKNVLLSASGNSLRSLMKYIERIPDNNIGNVEFPFNSIIIYDLTDDGHIVSKEVRAVEATPINA